MANWRRNAILAGVLVIFAGVLLMWFGGPRITDVTHAPPQYIETTYPVSFSGYIIEATVEMPRGATLTSLQSTVSDLIPGSTPRGVPMTSNLSQTDFAGRLPADRALPHSPGACGFITTHTLRAVYLGVLPVSAETRRPIEGNPLYQGVEIMGAPGHGAFVQWSLGSSITTPMVLVESTGVYLGNYYPSKLQVQSISASCAGASSCTAPPNPPLANISNTTTLPARLFCGQYVGVNFQCTPEGLNRGSTGQVEFVTDRGKITVPFACSSS
jgi:hypothetical protein